MNAVHWRGHCISGSLLQSQVPLLGVARATDIGSCIHSTFLIPCGQSSRPRVRLPACSFWWLTFLTQNPVHPDTSLLALRLRTFSSQNGQVLKPVMLPVIFFSHHGDRGQINVSMLICYHELIALFKYSCFVFSLGCGLYIETLSSSLKV